MMTLSPGLLRGAEHIVFDWNGTLIDDLWLAVRGVNHCAERYGVKPVTHASYREAFSFPISDFYARLGFDLKRTPFTEIVTFYLEYFDKNVAECSLHDGVHESIAAAERAGMSISILSASHNAILIQTLRAKCLLERFTHVVGLTDNLAIDKRAAAIRLQKQLGGNPERTIYVGDTLHDFEVANGVGWTPVLVATGHQSAERLLASKATVIKRLGDLARALTQETDAVSFGERNVS
jgi:phosphoglycolate phosphatase